jgi:hypothetical protein
LIALVRVDEITPPMLPVLSIKNTTSALQSSDANETAGDKASKPNAIPTLQNTWVARANEALLIITKKYPSYVSHHDLTPLFHRYLSLPITPTLRDCPTATDKQ